MTALLSELPLLHHEPSRDHRTEIVNEIREFRHFGKETIVTCTSPPETLPVPTFINEFWTSRQRAAHSLHEISYRACFKPQLPRFFILRLTARGETVYDPFMGRGTTVLEAALLGRVAIGCDINPLSEALVRPRLEPPNVRDVRQRLTEIDFSDQDEYPEDLLTFYHRETLAEICALRKFLLTRQRERVLDAVDRWIRMVAINRLTGHSPGFFSVYTLPPNQAVSVKSQIRINRQRGQVPPRRNVPELILKKTNDLLRDCTADSIELLQAVAPRALLLNRSANHTPEIQPESVSLIVTSPPFLDVVDYAGDNWLRCWFGGIDPAKIEITVLKSLGQWQAAMSRAFDEFYRILAPGGHVAFEVGEVRGGRVKLEEFVIPSGLHAGLSAEFVLINDQHFTKTANCWGVNNRQKGTNTNRIVVFRKKDMMRSAVTTASPFEQRGHANDPTAVAPTRCATGKNPA
jgi:SAM-dependent methyltransferase